MMIIMSSVSKAIQVNKSFLVIYFWCHWHVIRKAIFDMCWIFEILCNIHFDFFFQRTNLRQATGKRQLLECKKILRNTIVKIRHISNYDGTIVSNPIKNRAYSTWNFGLMRLCLLSTVKLRAVDWSTIQFRNLLAKGHSK